MSAPAVAATFDGDAASDDDGLVRSEYTPWAVDLRVNYYPHMLSAETVVALVQAGGTNGIGEWRPEKNGPYGQFTVAGN